MANKKTIVKKFNSAVDFLEWASKAECKWSGELASRKNCDPEWSGTETFEEAYNLALYGWEDGLKKLSREFTVASAIIVSPESKQDCFDVAGHRPHPARAAAGEILSMIGNARNEEKPKPIIKIRMNISYNGGVSPERIMKWGAAVCSYVNALEQQRYSVQLTAVEESRPSNNNYDAPDGCSFQFLLKKAGDKLSLSEVVFWWAHPSALRRVCFSALERLDIEEWYGNGYGRPSNVTSSEEGELSLSFNDMGSNMKENLEIIRNKHMSMLETNSPLRKTLPKFKPD